MPDYHNWFSDRTQLFFQRIFRLKFSLVIWEVLCHSIGSAFCLSVRDGFEPHERYHARFETKGQVFLFNLFSALNMLSYLRPPAALFTALFCRRIFHKDSKATKIHFFVFAKNFLKVYAMEARPNPGGIGLSARFWISLYSQPWFLLPSVAEYGILICLGSWIRRFCRWDSFFFQTSPCLPASRFIAFVTTIR